MRRALRVLVIPMAFLAIGSVSRPAPGSDEPATLKTQQLFYREPGMIDVEVRSAEGAMTLSGSVATDDLRNRADEIARQVGGVNEVRNRIRVEPTAVDSPPDEALLAEIEAQIAEDSELALVRPMLDITVEDSNVTLEGALPGWRLVSALIRGIRRIRGIKTLDFIRLTGE